MVLTCCRSNRTPVRVFNDLLIAFSYKWFHFNGDRRFCMIALIGLGIPANLVCTGNKPLSIHRACTTSFRVLTDPETGALYNSIIIIPAHSCSRISSSAPPLYASISSSISSSSSSSSSKQTEVAELSAAAAATTVSAAAIYRSAVPMQLENYNNVMRKSMQIAEEYFINGRIEVVGSIHLLVMYRQPHIKLK